jgi:hypothetical protein
MMAVVPAPTLDADARDSFVAITAAEEENRRGVMVFFDAK